MISSLRLNKLILSVIFFTALTFNSGFAEDEIVDIQFYSIQGVMQKDPETSTYIETELTAIVNISMINNDIKTNLKTHIIIGFMLDQEKIKI